MGWDCSELNCSNWNRINDDKNNLKNYTIFVIISMIREMVGTHSIFIYFCNKYLKLKYSNREKGTTENENWKEKRRSKQTKKQPTLCCAILNRK